MKEEELKKYEIIKNGTDDYVLKYKDKEIKFNSKVEFVYDLQEIIKNARLNMITDLASRGKTVDSLIVRTKNGAETIEDHSNVDKLEEDYIQEEQSKVMDNIIKKLFGVGYLELASDIGILNGEESKEFGRKIGEILRGETPRG